MQQVSRKLPAYSRPRVSGRTNHKLMDVLVISILAVISGSSTWNEIEDYGKAEEAWLAEFLSLEQGIPSHDTFTHGRFDTRRRWVMPYTGFLDTTQWEGLAYIVKVQRESVNVVTGKKSKETRYYITSDAACSPEKALHISRSHWGIENNLHWMLDVTFKEDHSHVRKANAAHNFGILRRMALTLLEKVAAPRISIQRRRYRASMDNDFALNVLNAI